MDEKERSEWEDLQQRILKAASDVVNLKITTTVGDVTMVEHESVEGIQVQPMVTNDSSLHTEVNILAGDIKTVVDQSLLTDEFDLIRALHNEREDHAHEIIQANLKTLTALANTLLEFLNPPDEDEG